MIDIRDGTRGKLRMGRQGSSTMESNLPRLVGKQATYVRHKRLLTPTSEGYSWCNHSTQKRYYRLEQYRISHSCDLERPHYLVPIIYIFASSASICLSKNARRSPVISVCNLCSTNARTAKTKVSHYLASFIQARVWAYLVSSLSCQGRLPQDSHGSRRRSSHHSALRWVLHGSLAARC